MVLAGGKAALQVETVPPQCGAVASFLAQARSLIASYAIQGASPQIIGLELMNGMSVWHLRSNLRLRLMDRWQEVVTDIYARALDYRIVRETATPALQINGFMVRERLSISFSQFGEPVNLSLPAKCQT